MWKLVSADSAFLRQYLDDLRAADKEGAHAIHEPNSVDERQTGHANLAGHAQPSICSSAVNASLFSENPHD